MLSEFFALKLEESLSGAFFHAKMTFLTIVAFPKRSFSKEKIGTRKNRSNNYVFLLETSEIIRSSINIANPACLVRSSTKKIWCKRKIWLMLVLWRDSKFISETEAGAVGQPYKASCLEDLR